MRKSYKTPEELEAAMIELYGVLHGSQRKLADAIGKHEVSMSRYMNKESPVDKTTANLIDELLEKHRAAKGNRRRPALCRDGIEDML